MLRLKSASCQIAYWQEGKLRIFNYFARRIFSATPAILELIRFFSAPRTIQDALVEFRPYSPESVARAIVRLIDAQLLLEYRSDEWKQDELVRSSWKPWLPEAGFHFMTKDTPFVPWDWPLKEKMKFLPATPPPRQFKTIPGADVMQLQWPKKAGDTFFETLHARRTHREFAKGKMSLEQVS